MKIKIKLLKDSATVPTKATEYAAAYDVRIPYDTVVKQGRQVIPLEFAIELPKGYQAIIKPRSGFSAKGMEAKDGRRKNADVIMGTIDADYRGSVGVIVHSHSRNEFTLPAGTRIAQMTIEKVESPTFKVVDELSKTKRGKGGFGSTKSI